MPALVSVFLSPSMLARVDASGVPAAPMGFEARIFEAQCPFRTYAALPALTL